MAVREKHSGEWEHLASAIQAAPAEDKERFEVLRHPWRVRILEVLSERDMSCAQMVDEGWIDDLTELDRSEAIPKLAYHFRTLRKVGAIEVVEEHTRRGSTERVCRGRARAYFSTEEWAKLPREVRRIISLTVLQGLVARAEGAVIHDTFDARIDRHLLWMPMNLDEQGWSDMAGLLDGVVTAAVQIRDEAEKRIAETGEQPIRSTFGQVHVESPPPPVASEE